MASLRPYSRSSRWIPPDPDWAAQLRTVARDYRQLALAHPHVRQPHLDPRAQPPCRHRSPPPLGPPGTAAVPGEPGGFGQCMVSAQDCCFGSCGC